MVVAVWLVITLRTLIVLQLVAGVLAAALDRPVNFLHRTLRLPSRGLAVLVVFLIGLGLIGGLGYLVYQPVADQGANLRQDLPNSVERLKDLPIVGPRLENVDLKRATERFFAELPRKLEGNRELILGVAHTALTVVALVLTTLVVVVFMLLNGPPDG